MTTAMPAIAPVASECELLELDFVSGGWDDVVLVKSVPVLLIEGMGIMCSGVP